MLEPYDDCERCYLGTRERHEQASYRCAHPCFPEREWASVDEVPIAVHMGAPKEWDDDGFPNDKPVEPHEDGCPGAWYRTPFVASVQRYMRHGEIESPLMALCTDRLVREAVSFYEYQCARARD